ncbi:MAG TPA: caspase family protein [Candidatus Polarisedimenticolia bacterium]|nr:caspase family protein [Candidatus Polarisedimenticolia bacterium]
MSRKALCVGINNYPGTANDLSGCVNDAKDWAAALKTRGYDITMLLDDKATRANMVSELTKLVTGGAKGDSLVFTYSGHGSWIPDDDGDDADGRDEMLCPYDISQNHYLLDDDLADIFAKKADGVRLHFISDSCHSGTVSRFAPLGPEFANQPKARFLPPETFLKSKDEIHAARRVALIGHSTRQKYPALLAAACQDVQFSYDANFGGRPNGAFTYWALKELDKKPETPMQWMHGIRTHLPTGVYPQNPRLYGSTAVKRGPMF